MFVPASQYLLILLTPVRVSVCTTMYTLLDDDDVADADDDDVTDDADADC